MTESTPEGLETRSARRVAETAEPEASGGFFARRRLLVALVAGATAAALAITGGFVMSSSPKTITLDINGGIVEISTRATSVAAALEGEGIRLGLHDAVTPAFDEPLHDGAEIVIRTGRQVLFEVDGEATTEWVAAMDASEALEQLSHLGRDVRLVASRGGGRAEVSLPLSENNGSVAIVADGRTQVVTYLGGSADDVLATAGVVLSVQDLVTVVDVAEAGIGGAGDARVALVVQRVLTAEDVVSEVLPYESIQINDAERFVDLPPVVRQYGVEGSATRRFRILLVDGVETERLLISDETVEPVNHIVAIGTRERPIIPGVSGEPIPDHIWVALAQCESGGRPTVISSNGLWHGLYQFRVDTWQSVGGVGLPSDATPEEQRMRAQMLQARSGWGQWPACARRLGLL
ncbi:MAG: transglycosylase family protein [Promicromonosporaceae bacterium]|nr:transglycosylase family protein [Promicromonosporaceae bacterium]